MVIRGRKLLFFSRKLFSLHTALVRRTTSAVLALGALVNEFNPFDTAMQDELDLMPLPPLSPSMELAFSEALQDLSEMEKVEESVVVKLETSVMRRDWVKAEECTDSMNLRMATPPPSASRTGEVVGMSPCEKSQATFKDSAEAKRARRSAIEKKSRQRRQEMLARMRGEVKQLEDVYTEMVMRSSEQSTDERGASRPISSATMDELQRKYSELSLIAHALEEDQASLRELLQTHENFQNAVGKLSEETQAEQALWDSGIPPSSSFTVPFRQYSEDECFAIVRQAYQEIERFLEADNFETTGASFMGWTDKRKVDHELQALQFCFTKKFPLESAGDLLSQTWNIFSNGDKMAAMSFDRSVRTRFEVLQVVNDNLIIIRRDHKIPSMPMTFFSVQIIFRLQTNEGFTMCSRTIQAPEIENAKEPHEYFYDAFHWTRFNHLYDEHGNPAGCEIVADLPMSSAMGIVLSKAFADTSEMEGRGDLVKMEKSKPKCDGNSLSVNLRVVSPPFSAVKLEHEDEIGGISPIVKGIATPKESADAKRARRSAIEKKSRQRRQGILNRMREEVKHLENVFADVTKKKEGGVVGLIQWHSLNGSQMGELQQKFSELTLVVHALEQDQTALQQLLQEHDNFNQTRRSLSSETRLEDAFAIWDSGVPFSSSYAAKFRPLTMAEGYSFVRDSYEEIRKFTDNENCETTGTSFMGWTDKRLFDQNTQSVQYSFTKQFPFERAERVFQKSWDTFLDGPELEKLAFDSSAQTRFEVLQVLNDDLLVIRRDHRMPRFPMTFTSIQILFRLQTPTGYTLCIRTISSPEIKDALEPHEFMIDVFHWTHFNRLYNEFDEPAGCEIVTAGSINDHNRLKSNYWLFEIVCSVLRWENLTIAPIFLLQT
ncbi:hypothetical protein P3T76_003987 [Phytophthora citrophthora]|uniref:Uncharacterized protein n=1 Tax=Phytophthora citrophthora TaxID=4793 RepID=A0AAD9LNX2_9STRA|nr:hypothetical protein P3T76_003987 [Phytophthora citrophthora]